MGSMLTPHSGLWRHVFKKKLCVCVYPCAVIAHSAASSQAGVKIGDPIRAADRRVLVDPAATVDVAATRQVPVSHRQSRTADTANT